MSDEQRYAASRTPASRAEQDTYYWLRSNVTAALAEELPHALAVCPKTWKAVNDLRRFTAYHPRTSFRIFRPEDAATTDQADSKLFLR